MEDDSELESGEYTAAESDWDSEANTDYHSAYYALLDRFVSRVASYMITDKIWAKLPDLITTYSWLEHNPLFRTGASYDNINIFKTRVGDLSAPMHQRHYAVRALTPADVISLLPVVMEDNECADEIFQGFKGILSRAQVRAFYYFVTMPDKIKREFMRIPDVYKVCHQIVEEAIEDRTAVSLLRANSMPCCLQPMLPLNKRGKRPMHKGQLRPPYKWTKKRADTLNEYP